MKIKLLIIPLVITMVVVASVWFIYPTYSNGKDGIRDHYMQLKNEQDKLASIRGKSGNVSKLLAQIDSLGEDKNIVTSFVPEDMNEDMIIKNMSQIAMDSGLAVLGLNIVQSSNRRSANPVASSKEMAGKAAVALPTPENFETSIQVSGDYNSIKSFLAKLGNFSRYNLATYVSIKKYVAPNESPEAAASSSTLTADIKVDYYFMDKVKLSDKNVGDNIFSTGNLNTEVVSLIKDKRSFYPYNLSIDQMGKENPFLP